MLTKDKVLNTIAKFPDNFSLDELVERMILLEKIEKGLEDSNSNRIIDEEELERQIEKWSK